MESGFELCFSESEVYAAWWSNCHALALRRVGGLGVKDMLGLSYAIGSNVAQFSVKDFSLISGQKCGTEPDITSRGDAHNRFMKAHFTNRGHITCNDLENAFLKSERGSEDSFKLGLLYFVEFVIMGKPQNVKINEEYLHLVHKMDEFNNYLWGSISFEFLQDSLLFAPRKKESDEENDREGKGQKKGKKEVWSSVRKGKKNVEDEKPKRINRLGWSIKGLSYALQIWVYELIAELGIPPLRYCKRIKEPTLPVILCLLRPSQLEMSQPYWSWGSDVPECDAPSVAPRVCKDLDELNYVVQQLRNEVAVLHREKGQLEERVLRLKKCTSHADARKTEDAREERNKTEDAGEDRNKTEDAREESQKTEDDDAGEESQKTEDAGEESDKTEDGVCHPCLSLVIPFWRFRNSAGNGDKKKSKFRLPVLSEISHVRLCGKDGMEGSHNFFVRLLSKDGWLDDSNIDMALLLLRELHKSSGNWVGFDWTILDTIFQKCAALDYNKLRRITQAIQRAMQPVAKMLPRLVKESRYIGDGLLLKSEWPVIRIMDAPQQVGGGNFGMYILKYCEFLTSNVDLAKISHDSMPFYRLKLAVQLLQGYW
ncbi:unnamed protein product [Prunus brigantina]